MTLKLLILYFTSHQWFCRHEFCASWEASERENSDYWVEYFRLSFLTQNTKRRRGSESANEILPKLHGNTGAPGWGFFFIYVITLGQKGVIPQTCDSFLPVPWHIAFVFTFLFCLHFVHTLAYLQNLVRVFSRTWKILLLLPICQRAFLF